MMGGGRGNGGDAERWLTTAQKLLLSGDLNGSKTYAIRACEADHSLVDPAELILAVADTLIAGESRIRGSTADLPDWYAVLRLVRLTHNPELVATQYSKLAVLLDPSRNRFPYSEQAFRLISDAWYVLSDPSRKAMYDKELHLSQLDQLGQLGFQLFNQPPQSPQQQQQQQQEQSSIHQTMSFQSQQLPFQLRQQPSLQQQRSSQFEMQSQQLFVPEQSEMVRSGDSSSSSGRDWKLAVPEQRCINLNNATERVQSQYEEASTSTEWTWSSKPTPTTVRWQSSEPSRQFHTEAAQLSLLHLVSDQPQPNRSSTQSHSVSKPQPVSRLFPTSQQQSNHFPMSKQTPVSNHFSVSQSSQKSKPFVVSQPPPTSNPLLVSQPKPNTKPLLSVPQPQPPSTSSTVSQPLTTSKLLPTSKRPTTSKTLPVTQPPQEAFQSTSHSQLPEAFGAPSPLPPVSNSTQSFQPPPVPAVSTNPSPPPPPPVSQPTFVANTEQTPIHGTASCDSDPKVPSFWTTCPYCFVLYEYPSMYEESVLKCQTKTCRRAFQAVKIPSPPPVTEKDSYYCCWGFYPIGFADAVKFPVKDLPKAAAPRIFPVNDLPRSAPKKPSPVYYNDDDDDDSYIDSDPSEDKDDDDDWQMSGRRKKKQKASTKPKLGRPPKVIQVD